MNERMDGWEPETEREGEGDGSEVRTEERALEGRNMLAVQMQHDRWRATQARMWALHEPCSLFFVARIIARRPQ
jgi:hypothetical protein